LNGTKPTVIVIDDDPSILRALRRLLCRVGFDVQTLNGPAAALKSDLPTAEACLLVDMHMPEMSGVELCEMLACAGCRLPVILMTAHTDERTREFAKRVQPVALLIKPFGNDLLVSSIRGALHTEQ